MPVLLLQLRSQSIFTTLSQLETVLRFQKTRNTPNIKHVAALPLEVKSFSHELAFRTWCIASNQVTLHIKQSQSFVLSGSEEKIIRMNVSETEKTREAAA